MANFPANPITEVYGQFSPNIANAFMTFNLFLGAVTYSYPSGTGTAINTTAKYYKQNRSLLLTSTDDSTDFIVNHGADTRFTATEAKQHFFQFQLNNPFGGCSAGELFALGVSINGGSSDYYVVNVVDMDGFDTWKGFYFDFPLEIADTVDFSWKLKANTSGTDHKVYFDGFKIECGNRVNAIPSAYTLPLIAQQPDILSLTTNLDFPSTAAGATSVLIITFPRAPLGKPVQVGFAPESVFDNCSYDAYVNLPNVVYVRFQNNSAVSVDPPLAEFNLQIQP